MLERQKFSQQLPKRPWRRALFWLLLLGPGFFLLYGSVNHLTAAREPVASFFLPFEHSIPVVQWHILPYMLLDLMFAISLFLCRSKVELDQHAKRLGIAIIICCLCFLLWPLKFGFERPIMDGFWGVLHNKLTEFDLPYNQAPSLHVVLVCLVGFIFLKHSPKWLQLPIIIWCALIVISVLTTHQHHSIDIVTAIPITLFCFCICPDNRLTKHEFKQIRAHDDSHWIGILYLFLTILCFSIGSLLGYWGAILVIPGLACALMTTIYLCKDERIFLKKSNGSTHWMIKCVLFPITLVQLGYKRWYSSKVNAIDEIIPGVFISRRLNNSEFNEQMRSKEINTLIDVAPEFEAPKLSKNFDYIALNWLDLAPVRTNQLNAAADALANAKKTGNVIIECKLGLQRSVLVVLAYLIKYEDLTVNKAFALLQEKRSGAVLREKQKIWLEKLST